MAKSDGPTNPATQSANDALADVQASVDQLIREAQSGGGDATAAPATLPDLGAPGPAATPAGSIELLSDVDLQVSIELGRTEMLVEDVLRLGEGSVVELDKLAGDPVDVYVNNRLVARGEVLVLNDNFCIRISEIVRGLSPDGQEAPADGVGG
jgi:flagellar motor switch protein FliN/FliY